MQSLGEPKSAAGLGGDELMDLGGDIR
jgi:hypothetical protein